MKILVVDAYNMIHRSRFGYSRGDYAIIYTFFRSLKAEIRRHSPDRVIVVSEGVPRHRLEINSEYKGQRQPVKDAGFHRQKREILDLCKKMPITFMRHPDYECDDVIGYICRNFDQKNTITIVSTDTDFIQLLDVENVKLWNPVKKKFIDRWPVDYVTWKALKGDPTDNVPGIKGVGEKRAFALCETSSVLYEFLVAEESRKSIFESAYEQIKLADIDDESAGWEIDHCRFEENMLKKAFTGFGFKSIVDKGWADWTNTMEKLDDTIKNYADKTTAS
jgi:DNA polymerase-1